MAASTSSFFLFLAFLLGLAWAADSAAGTVAGAVGCMGASEPNIWLMLAVAGGGGCGVAVTKGVEAAAGVRLLFNKQGHHLNLLIFWFFFLIFVTSMENCPL